MTLHFIWYWFMIGVLVFGAATGELIYHTRNSAKFDFIAAAVYILGSALVALSVTRDLLFALVFFAIPFGIASAVANWMSLKSRADRVR